MNRVVSISNRHPRLRFDRAAVARIIHTLEAGQAALRLPHSAFPAGDLSLVFLTDPAIAGIHGDFLQDPTATDVITFAGDAATGLAGEICVSADAAARYAGLPEGRPPGRPRPDLQKAFSAELTLYIVHGWLHLAGYDDLQPAKKRRMRAAEKRAMDLLRNAQAIPVFHLHRFPLRPGGFA